MKISFGKVAFEISLMQVSPSRCDPDGHSTVLGTGLLVGVGLKASHRYSYKGLYEMYTTVVIKMTEITIVA